MSSHDYKIVNRTFVGILATLLLVVLVVVVWGNDKGSATEVGLLQGTPATNAQCDAMYNAEWIARHTPAHKGIVQSIKRASCPW